MTSESVSITLQPFGRTRIISVLISLMVFIVFLPFIVMITIILSACHFGNPIYSHKRVGFRGEIFGCLKFKTMRTNSAELLSSHLRASDDAKMEWMQFQKLKNDPRVLNRFCRFLRRSGLDELPQIFNVLRGDMNLIGPRPITLEELARYGEHSHAYKSVRPGLTGIWQVSGRNETSYDERIALDMEYINGSNFGTDIVILYKTAFQIFTGNGR